MRTDCQELPNGCFKTGDGRVVCPDPDGKHLLVDGMVVRAAVREIRKRRYTIGDNNCWQWLLAKSSCGYGQMKCKGETKSGLGMSHRVYYRLLFGKIEEKMTIDHLCRNRACINPSHLEIVTLKENNLRGFAPPALNAKKEFCPRGHRYAGYNLSISNCGKGRLCRKCKTCARERAREKRRLLA